MKFILTALVAAVVVSGCFSRPAIAAEQKAVLAGGCFWGVEGVFERVKGVIDVRSGYSGGTRGSANYYDVSDGKTRHAEAVEIRFNPSKVTFEQLLKIFFTVVHDPTELNRQGPDIGPQYRSAVFYTDDEQKKTANEMIASLAASKVYKKKIVTQVVPLAEFYPAEDEHQDYMRKNPEHPYIVYHDVPKVEAFKTKFPELVKK